MNNYMNFIDIHPSIMFGKPVIKGTRITVEIILEDLAVGKTPADLIQAYPRLNQQSIWAALSFAAASLRGERTYPIAV